MEILLSMTQPFIWATKNFWGYRHFNWLLKGAEIVSQPYVKAQQNLCSVFSDLISRENTLLFGVLAPSRFNLLT